MLIFFVSTAHAGLDLENQTEIYIPDLDLDHDGRIHRTELAEYLFFYFDHDGNESLTKGEYRRERAFTLLPYEAEEIEFIDLDHDGKDDGLTYDMAAFLQTVMVDKEAAAIAIEDGQFDAEHVIDLYFSRLDINKNRAIDMDEWQDEYAKHGVIKPKKRPKAANNNRYN